MRPLSLGLLLCLLGSAPAYSQGFQLAGKHAVKVPAAALQKIKQYIQTHDGIAIVNDPFGYVPVFNVLSSQTRFADGLYFFSWGAHDSGRLFINQKGRITFLANASTARMVADYLAFLKTNEVPEAAQITYLSAIAAFMKYRHADQKMLIKSGALLETK